MSPAVERREYSRQHSPDRSDSVVRRRHSPHRGSSPRGERFPPPGTSSPYRNNYSKRGRSPVKEKLPDRVRSPKQTRQKSHSSSPSPRTKRLRRVQADRETQKLAEREHGKNSSREEQDKGRHRERGEGRDGPSERRSGQESHDDGSSRSSRRDGAVFTERSHSRRHSSRSPLRASKAAARDEVSMSREIEQYGNDDFDTLSKMKATEDVLEAKDKDKQKPSFELSGKLAEETNRVRGITLLFNEPPDACKPDIRWRLYVFKAGEVLNEPLYVHRQSCYLFGRERRVADIPTDHPSCSKQHAVLQYRSVDKEQADGLMSKQVRPYLMDLGSTNAGSMLCFTRTQLAEWHRDHAPAAIHVGFIYSSLCSPFLEFSVL
ncbi:FHA domain-containing protein DDL isoform X1 [Dendrobium catenatum]|uniref:FHA domain-containing protein DDL isoform X1 n=1 Tax=Dendrobium catenatum TaxID=906689 RepID=UPI0009F6F8FD|nr:FHA domain-containing protein DDL isoform X1 [Dendrobium catenatum]XP_020674613.1 FHA domain-containing protein DDL isoform X1 [Dendrobium catenatum]XP_020674614.1 FHA domain-containing protein DDL isoform X1 [Dendrobium catenatum]XP_020674615.1 FHA domain-containing protein DDL isoform X1 [Dendrobium catenatum]XP_020674617.1 FHA domain-containing protein DDL isoform X1 [Dendrobium catenatum]XP_020674618.1 FHA domain-containing protein DDL isoform X1 [Dendrobium catenatum]XP_028549657.1 FH